MQSLANSQRGTYECVEIRSHGDDALRLKRLGICEGRSLELLTVGDPLIVRIGQSQIGLSRQLAAEVAVTRQ